MNDKMETRAGVWGLALSVGGRLLASGSFDSAWLCHVAGGAGAIGGAIRVGFRAIAKPYGYGVRLPVCSSSRDPGELL